jgi:hypothetical protein
MFMLLLSFIAIYWFKKTSIDASNEFPEVNCERIRNTMGDGLVNLAGREYEDWMIEKTKAKPDNTLNGALQCFCDN